MYNMNPQEMMISPYQGKTYQNLPQSRFVNNSSSYGGMTYHLPAHQEWVKKTVEN